MEKETGNEMKKAAIPKVFFLSLTESAPNPIQSVSRDVCGYVCCMSPPSTTVTERARDFWSSGLIFEN